MFLLLPFDSLIVNLLGISLTVLFTLLLVFIIVPAVFGVSFGIRKLYMKTLLKIFAESLQKIPLLWKKKSKKFVEVVVTRLWIRHQSLSSLTSSTFAGKEWRLLWMTK